MSTISIDYETRSRCDLKATGAYKYSQHESTDVFMAAVSSLDSAETYLWINPRYPTPAKYVGQNAKAEQLLAEAKLLYAFSVQFEIALTWGTLRRGAPCPFKVEPPLESWRDTAALARKAGLPGDLGRLSEALNLTTQKDRRGKALIKFFSEPCTTGKNKGNFNEPKDHLEKWELFCDYCVTDVVAEKGAQKKLKAFELTGAALDTYLFDLRMNREGIPVNRKALVNAQKIIDDVQERVGTEFRALTKLEPTQREAVRQWLKVKGVDLADMTADTLKDLKLDGIDPEAQRAIFLYRKLAYAAVKKVTSMLNWSCDDDRMRGVLKYHGASTGRWSSGGPQIQNAKKPTADLEKLTPYAFAAIESGTEADGLDCIYGDPYEVVASCVRHFVGNPGQDMLDGDYNAIEGRIACWISGQRDILECWRRGEDLYKRATAFVENIPESAVTKAGRNFGKVVELASQFGLGTEGFMRTCDAWGIPCDEDKAHRAVHEYYRPTHGEIVKRWYYMDDCMRKAITQFGSTHGPISTRMVAGMRYMLLKLPSGRSLAYPDPQINTRKPNVRELAEMKKGKNFHPKRFEQISFWGQMQPSTVWGRVNMHGSLAFQNEVQGIAACVMGHGAVNAERQGMRPFALIHDQGLALCTNGQTGDEFAAALASLPAWAKGLPLKVEAKRCKFYSK